MTSYDTDHGAGTVPMETYMKHNYGNTMYFITITLSPKLYKYYFTTQYDMTVNELRSILLTNADKSMMVIESTKQANVHYHGIVLFKDEIQKLVFIDKIKRKRVFGFCKITDKPIDTLESFERAFKYLTKDIKTTERLLYTRAGYKPDILFMVK